jgi:hypothetical protein
MNLLSEQKKCTFLHFKINVNALAQVSLTVRIRRAMQLLSLSTQLVFYLVNTSLRLGNRAVMG